MRTTGAVAGDVPTAEEAGPVRDGVLAAVVIGDEEAIGSGREGVGGGADMIEPETPDTRLIGSGILPGLARRL